MTKRKRCCCNCGHNLRIPDKREPLLVDHNECEIDGHYIGYVECFTGWCKRWKKEDKWKRWWNRWIDT